VQQAGEPVHREGFWLVGRQAKASNDDPGPIGALWGEHFERPFKDLVEGRVSDDIYSVYCEYEGDYTKPYTVFLGYRVEVDATTPPGLTRRFVPAGRFALRVADGPIPDALMEAWAAIWASDLDRTYNADYEVHPAAGGSPVNIFVGVR